MTVAELKEHLKEAGLPVSGERADLISSLQETEARTLHVENETCIGIDSEKYRGHYVRCSNIPADKSKYCEEHKSQGKWGLKKDLEDDDENNFILIFL